MGNRRLQILCYANDAGVVGETKDNLQRLLQCLEVTVKKYEMPISTEKLKQCNFQSVTGKLLIKLIFNYQWVQISVDGNMTLTCNGCSKVVIWRNAYLLTEVKTRIYKPMCVLN